MSNSILPNPTGALNRRAFLTTAAVGGVTAVLGQNPRTGLAAEPVKRTGKPRMKLSLAAYSFESSLDLKKPTMTLDDFIQFCAELDLDGTELTSYYFPTGSGHDYLMHIKELTVRLGLGISATAVGNDFCHPPGEERDKQLALAKQWIDNAVVMGTPVVRLFGGYIKRGDSADVAIERTAAGVNECLDYAAPKGIRLALENHSGITETPEQMAKIMSLVKPSPWFGTNFNTQGFRGADPYSQLATIAPYAINVHMQPFIFRGNAREETDMQRAVNILAEAGYRGYVAFHYAQPRGQSQQDHKVALRDYIERLRKMIRAVG
jgi:sugar phosphate isomerase/epimerase